MSLIVGWLGNHLVWVLLFTCVVVDYTWFRAMRDRMFMSARASMLASIFKTAISLFGAKALSAIEVWDFAAFSGMRLFGAVFIYPVVVCTLARLAKKKCSDMFDILSISFIDGLLIMRFSCIASGCCQGLELPGFGGIRWPLREMEMLLYVILLLWYIPKIKNRKTHGEVYPLFMIIYGVFRLAIEWLREEYISFGLLHTAHIWSLLSILVGAGVYFTLSANRTRQPKKVRR